MARNRTLGHLSGACLCVLNIPEQTLYVCSYNVYTQ